MHDERGARQRLDLRRAPIQQAINEILFAYNTDDFIEGTPASQQLCVWTRAYATEHLGLRIVVAVLTLPPPLIQP